MTTQRFGLAHEMERNVLPLQVAKMYRDQLGCRDLRYMTQRRHLEPERGTFDLSTWFDETINNARAAGLRVIVNPYFLNPWMTLGRELVSSYQCECTDRADPRTIEAAPQCYDLSIIGEIDSDAIHDQAVVIATHAKGRVDTFGVENEPGVRDYMLESSDDTPQTLAERWYRKIAKPFVLGVRSVIPNAQFMTEFDLFFDYGHCLELDRDHGDNLGKRCFSVIGTHPYAENTDAVIAKVRDEFRARMAPWLDGRPLAIGEIQGVDNIRLMRELEMDVTEHRPARYITMHQEWSQNGPLLVAGLQGGPATYELTEEGKRHAAAMREYDPELFAPPAPVHPVQPPPTTPKHQRPTRRRR